jgi:hypothetical protein
VGNVRGEESPSVDKVFENASGVVYDIAAPQDDAPHPSGGTCVASDARVRIAARFSLAERAAAGASLTVAVPKGFRTGRVEIAFAPSVVEPIPESIEVYPAERAGGPRLNASHSGEWIESLAADSLLRRRSPVATVRLNAPRSGDLHVAFLKSMHPPIERLALCGEWAQ